MAVVKNRPALHNSVDFIFKSFGIIGSILVSLMRLNWSKLASLAQKQSVNLKDFSCFGELFSSKGSLFRTYLMKNSLFKARGLNPCKSTDFRLF